MVGLNGVVVKSHGGTDAMGFAHAVDVAMDMVTHRFNDRIREDLARIALDKRGPAEKNGRDREARRPRPRCTVHRGAAGCDPGPAPTTTLNLPLLTHWLTRICNAASFHPCRLWRLPA